MANSPTRDPSLPPEHLGNIPAGHKRDEENRRRTDNLAERLEKETPPFEAIDPAKFKAIENEVVGGMRRNVNTGILFKEVSNKQPGYLYCWMKNPATCRTIEGEMAAEMAVNTFFGIGGEWVEGDMPEAQELRGAGKDNLGSRRGWADCLLVRIKREFYEANERNVGQRAARQGLIEQETVNQMQARGFTGSADPNHPAFRHSGVQNPGQAMQYQFNEGDLRRGTIRDPRTGKVLEPGYDNRR